MSDPRRFVCPHVREMHGYVPGEQPRIPGLIKLNTNENPYPPSPRVLVALAGMTENRLRLYPDPLCLALRERIAGLHGCRIEQIIVGNGSDELLALCTRAFVADRGTIGFFDPSYSLYPVLADIRPAQRRPVDLNDDYSWRTPARDLSSLFYLTNPNAPTSMLFNRESMRAFCRDFDGVVVMDEAYVDFAPEHCLDFALEFSNVLVSRSLSKSYSLAGARVGYLVGHEELIGALYKIKDSYNVNAVTQALALAALEDQAYMRSNVARIVATRSRVAAELSRRGCKVYPSATNFLWLEPRQGQAPADVFTHLRDQNILVRYFPGEKTGRCLRITIGTDEQMNRLLDVWPA